MQSLSQSDFSPSMIQVLDKFINELEISNIESKVMDGQNLEQIKDSSLDYTFSTFGLIYFPDILQGMKEMFRVLKPGGKTGIASWCTDAFLPAAFQQTMNALLGNSVSNRTVLLIN
ncbi:hypothetical protein DICPUDRAFT_79274 [Dictyostelium purpureum]|uniref:Methyltransferase type 11 domain-containing protein n=1 Tax=Dictyostelium purpureum TaxID=5786 RepID=F0ZM34_DICPU|nr:uncharacterized protein DICPUDRAFT_79274 [Dictyostelium purpureum]EGC34998.1 hypothetical protein DICPUDRAFT_79274 [Dictyostelium purpureum]|eukprot:XP_003288472.1 hypothetical protein DICPUDRAFT_79274 [Dictyostelium purpureum]